MYFSGFRMLDLMKGSNAPNLRTDLVNQMIAGVKKRNPSSGCAGRQEVTSTSDNRGHVKTPAVIKILRDGPKEEEASVVRIDILLVRLF